MSTTAKTYTVTIMAWAAYSANIEAASEEEAIEIAEALYMDDFDRFNHRDGGVSDIFADDREVLS